MTPASLTPASLTPASLTARAHAWPITLITTLALAGPLGCDVDRAALEVEPTIPAAHPCPEWALTPTDARLWEAARASGEPVPLALALPLPPGEPVAVSQGNDQPPTHRGDDRWAWDFALPEGSLVRAAAPGRVVIVRADSTRYGSDPSYRGDANFVIIDHGGGLFSAYVHLAAGGALVAPGQRVAAGDPLAVTGLSGQLSGAHLHFHVANVWGESLPVRFADPPAERCDLRPRTGDVVTADATLHASLVARDADSPMPPDTFAAWGVRALTGLPARLLERRARYRVRGQAAAGAVEVYALLIPPEGGAAVASWRLPVTDGAFSGELSLAAVPPGNYGIGLVAVGPDDDVFIDRTVRATVL